MSLLRLAMSVLRFRGVSVTADMEGRRPVFAHTYMSLT